jgi:hypothetical protein
VEVEYVVGLEVHLCVFQLTFICLSQWNKAISLAGLTVLCLAFIVPRFFFGTSDGAAEPSLEFQHSLCWHAFVMLELHSCYSAVKYYGSKHIPRLEDWKKSSFVSDLRDKKTFMEGVKKLSITLGVLGQVSLVAGCFGMAPGSLITLAFASSISLGTAHFYSMEIDFKKRLQVRPFALLPFPLAAAVVSVLLWRGFAAP